MRRFLLLLSITALVSAQGEDAAKAEREALHGLRRVVPKEAIEKGLRYLASAQDPLSGSVGKLQGRLGVTALSALAFMAHGDVDHGRGRFGDRAHKAIGFLLDHQDERGYFHVVGDRESRMHGHGYATLALAQASGAFGGARRAFRTPETLRESLRRAVALIVKSQGKDGGWMYEPRVTERHEGSVTATMAQALRAARDAGLHVPRATVDRALRYLRRSQKPDGSFRYALDVDRSSFELTAAATTCFLAFGEYQASEVIRGRDHLKRGLDTFLREPGHPLYGSFYAAQVLWASRDLAARRADLERILRFVLGMQDEESGAFRLERLAPSKRRTLRRQSSSTLYVTAAALLTLQIPNEILPLFHR